VERAVRIIGGNVARLITRDVKGASAFARGRARAISGITTNNATGTIVIHLNAADSAFDNGLALPALGIVSSRAPLRSQPNSPPVGVGPYEITNIVPNVSFSLVENPYWGQMNSPQIPSGHANINVRISSKPEANAVAVLRNSADVLDWADTIPGDLLSRIHSEAADRYANEITTTTDYVFFGVRTKPFSSQLAREAVVTGLNQNLISQLASGSLVPGCYYVPPTVVGWTATPCPYGNPAGGGNVTHAKLLVRRSGMAGARVTVWSPATSPYRQWMAYYTSFLSQIGFKATEKVISDPSYFSTLGNPSLEPQTGFAALAQGFPDPIYFYSLLTGAAIARTNSLNFGRVSDKHINTEVRRLEAVPTSDLISVASQWQALTEYVAKNAYVGVLGYQAFPAFTSSAINRNVLVFNPVYGWDWSSFELK
jgi:peptide/nickel transport system substrate-binding protein